MKKRAALKRQREQNYLSKTDIIIRIVYCFTPFLLCSKDTFLFIKKFLLQIDINGIMNRTECNRHLCRKTAVISCHRCLKTLVLEIKYALEFEPPNVTFKSKFWYSHNCLHFSKCAIHCKTFSAALSIISDTLIMYSSIANINYPNML